MLVLKRKHANKTITYFEEFRITPSFSLILGKAPATILFLMAMSSHADPAKVLVLSRLDAGKSIGLENDSIAAIELPDNVSTGYDWEYHASSSSIAILGTYYRDSDVPLGVFGAPGTTTIYVAAAQKGAAVLDLQYKRHWEKEIAKKLSFTFIAKAAFTAEFVVPKDNPPNLIVAPDTLVSDLPEKFNWCGGEYPDNAKCPPIRNQALCGACWAFATIAPLEILIQAKDGVSADLSEQYLVSCADDNKGCESGRMAFQWLVDKAKPYEDLGAPLESTFPYIASEPTCKSPYEKAYRGDDFAMLPEGASVETLKQAIYEHGPLFSGVNGHAFNKYKEGIIADQGTKNLNHAVVIIGWDETDKASKGYWYIRNQWGPNWGEKGYVRMNYGVWGIGFYSGWIDYKNLDTDSDTESDSSTDSESDSDMDTDTGSDDRGKGCGCTKLGKAGSGGVRFFLDLLFCLMS